MEMNTRKTDMDKGSSVLKHLFPVVLCLALSLLFTGARGHAATVTRSVTITHATEDDFNTTVGRFPLGDDTKVYGVDGNRTQLQYLPLPCIADVTVNPTNGGPGEVIRLRVTKTTEKKARREMTLPE